MPIPNDLIEKIRNDPEVARTEFNEKILHRIGDMCSIHGYVATRIFLVGRNEYEAKVLLKVLGIIEGENLPFEMGELILKNLNTLKNMENLPIYEKYK